MGDGTVKHSIVEPIARKEERPFPEADRNHQGRDQMAACSSMVTDEASRHTPGCFLPPKTIVARYRNLQPALPIPPVEAIC